LKKLSWNLTKTTNIEELLAQLGIQVVNVGSREISCSCPFHPDKHPSFSINSETGLWICYQCGASGTLEKLIQQVAGVNEPKELKTLVRHMQRAKFRPAPRKSAEDAIKEGERLYIEPMDPYYLYAKYSSFGTPPDWALEERMINRDAAQVYGLHWSKGWIIPIWAPRKMQDIVLDFWGWQSKRLDEVNNYPPGIKKSETLFGLTHIKGRTAVLVESPLDVVRMASAGIDAVASFGAFVSKYQISLIEAKLDKVVLALDNDKVGKEQMARLYPKLRRKMPTSALLYPEEVKDPGDMSDEQLVEALPDGPDSRL
jgi:DNA primase